MPNLLHTVKSMRIYSHELHPTTLFIYDEYMVLLRKRFIILKSEATISYNHVSQVYLRKGVLTSSLEIINTGGVENIEIRHLPKGEAEKAKRLIDQKIFHTHAKFSPIMSLTEEGNKVSHNAPDFEKKLARLSELRLKGSISKSEFDRRKREMLKSL